MTRKIALAALLLAAAGCGGPQWVRKGSSVFPPSERMFYGVGRADASIPAVDLRAEAAENRARAELQRYFDTYMGYLMQDYEGADGQQADRVIKTFSAGHLSGVRIVDRYQKGDTIYALARLDLEEFRKVVRAAPELTERTRQYLIDHSDKLFDKLKEEEVRQGAVKER